MKLLYRGTRDGMEGNYFHNKCNNEGPTISLFKNEKEIFLEDILRLIGQVMVIINQLQILLYLH